MTASVTTQRVLRVYAGPMPTVLIVGPCPVRHVLRERFEAQGIAVVEAANDDEAIAEVDAGGVDVVLIAEGRGPR